LRFISAVVFPVPPLLMLNPLVTVSQYEEVIAAAPSFCPISPPESLPDSTAAVE
jgi:hypothetical protein